MTPFPEAEIMTIKRLEVALRKMDYKLLKDGAYKLHEKYHSGHKFEYLDLLKDIYNEVMQSSQVPFDVKDILCSTIEDILTMEGIDIELQDSTQQPQEQIQVSSLTSLSYTTPVQTQEEIKEIETEAISEEESIQEDLEETLEQVKAETAELIENIETEEEIEETEKLEQVENLEELEESLETEEEIEQEAKLNAFEAFGTNQAKQETHKTIVQSPFSAQPFKEFTTPTIVPMYQQPTTTPSYVPSYLRQYEPIQEPTKIQETIVENKPEPTIIEEEQLPTYKTYEPKVEPTEVVEEITEEPIKEKKSVAIFYGQDSSLDKIKNILELRDLLTKTAESALVADVCELISEISTQSNNNVIELQSVLEQIKKSGNKTSLITNSQSSLFFELFDKNDATYSLYKNKEDKDITFSPLYGLTNLFTCSECEHKHLVKNEEIKPLVLECPKCKGLMFPELYAPLAKAEIDIEYYNSSLISLANSKVWLLIHPSFNGKISSDLIESAFKVSSKVEEVYILDKDINVREAYKNIFSKINPNVKVNIQTTALEDFINSI